MAFTYTGEQVDLGFGRGWLNRPAASSIMRIDRQLGHPLQITEAGRTWEKQNAHYQTYLRVGYPIALSPNAPSIHQMGGAIDSNEAQRIVAILEDHGWRRTVYRWVGGVWTLVEPWHFEYFERLDNHRNEPAGNGSNPFEEDDMYDDNDRKRDNAVADFIGEFRHVVMNGEPGVDLSKGRLDQAITAVLNLHQRFFVKGEHGEPIYDLTQLTVNEIKPMLLTLIASIGRLSGAPDGTDDVAALADAIRDGLGEEVAVRLADELAKRMAS